MLHALAPGTGLVPRRREPSRRSKPFAARAAAQPMAGPRARATHSSNVGGLNFEPLVEGMHGPPRVVSLLNPAPAAAAPVQDRSDLPLLLYLPGIDGTGLAASRQFPSLQRVFDLRVFVTPQEDRTSFDELVSLVAGFLEAEVPTCPPTRPVYILGESFGGVLALAVAAKCPGLVDRLVLVNPATSFPRTPWPLIGPLLTQVPEELYGALPLALAPVLGSPLGLLAAGLENEPTSAAILTNRAPDSANSSLPGSTSGGELSLDALPQQAARLAATAVNLLQQLPVLARILPADTLAWKIELLAQGCAAVAPLLAKVQQRTFILAAGADLLIPSPEEGRRLQRALPRAQLKVMPGRSHALLQEGGVNLAAILAEEGFYTRRRRMSAPVAGRSTGSAFGLAAPIELPTEKELDRYSERTTALARRLSSPVFISTCADGRRELGLGQIPAGRPLLLVGNHQTLALDLGMMCEQFLRERDIMLRGLAHPVIFAESFRSSSAANGSGSDGSSSSSVEEEGPVSSRRNGSERGGLAPWDAIPMMGSALASGRGLEALQGLLPGGGGSQQGMEQPTDGRSAFRSFMAEFGAVPVSPFTCHRLLSNGEAVLLFPGGVREAYKRRGEEYQLFWPEKPEIVRLAAKFSATIVPFAAIGLDDNLIMVADKHELERLPLIGQSMQQRSSALPQARRGVTASANIDESFVAPLMVPKLPPGRMYFCFQKPIVTSPADAKDRKRAEQLYGEVKASVQDGIQYLLQQRKLDPYEGFVFRALYEAAYNGRQAPTFPIL